ncbi:GTP-binding protein RAD-like, partial [Scleropages formosus]
IQGIMTLRNSERARGGGAHSRHKRSLTADGALLSCALPSPETAEPPDGALRPPRDGATLEPPDPSSSSSSSSSSCASHCEGRAHKVVVLGEHGVGKSSLAQIFAEVEDGHESEESGRTYSRSIVVDEEEAALVLYDVWEQRCAKVLCSVTLQESSPASRERCMRMGDAYVIVYSVTDRASFEKASELRIQLRRTRQSDNIPIILVGNKSDLVRSREVSVDEGRACAMVFDCKFIETSASLHHNVSDLFEGIVRQIRLRNDSKEQIARRQASLRRRESIGRKAKRFISRMVARKNKKMAFRQKSKSCHDLTVL